MEQGLTLEQLQQMGVKQITPKPEQQPVEAGFSLEEMQRNGAKEIKPKVIPKFDAQGRKINEEKYAEREQNEQDILDGFKRVGVGLAEGTKEQFAGGTEKIKSSITGGVERMQTGVAEGGISGGLKFGRAALETGLGAASGAVQTAFAPVTSAIGTGIQGWIELDKATGGKVKDSVASIARSNPELVSKFNKMIAYDPQLTTDVIDLINVLGVKSGVKATAPTIAKVAESTTPIVEDLVKSGVQAGKEMLEQRATNQTKKIIDARAEELRNISNNYVSLKKQQIYNKDFDESIKRVAETDVLVGAVDENGLISTKGKGGAIERYKAETLDGAEQVVRTNLESLGEVVNLSSVEKTLTDAVNKSGLEGADLKSALSSIKKEIAGYKLKADVNGNVPLTLIQDAKVSKTKGINYLTPPNVGVKDKAIANGLRKIVEDNSVLNVREINNELSKYLKDADFLESLDGKRVKGGKLGKYFAQISGNIIGGTAGNAVGGPFGGAIGTIIGGELGGKIKGTLMSKTLKGKTGTIAPENKIIKEATRKATEYKKSSDDLKSFIKTYSNEATPEDNIIKLDAKNKKALNKWLNSTPEDIKLLSEAQKTKELKEMYDAMYETGIEKYNNLIKYQEGGANNKFSDGLPEILGKRSFNSNGKRLAPNSYAQEFQKQGDSLIEELGFKDRDEANDFLESFKKLIEQRKSIKEDYSKSVGNLNQQYNPTAKTNNSAISPKSTPTPTKSKGIRGMVNFSEWKPKGKLDGVVTEEYKSYGQTFDILKKDFLKGIDDLNSEKSNVTVNIGDTLSEAQKFLKMAGGGNDLTPKANRALKDMYEVLQGAPDLIKLVPNNKLELVLEYIKQNDNVGNPFYKDMLSRFNTNPSELVPKKKVVSEVPTTAFHGTQAKDIVGTPKTSMGKMGDAFYVTVDKNKASAFGKEKNIQDNIIGASGKTIERTFRDPNFYPTSNVHSFDLSKLNIKTVADDREFFKYIHTGDVKDAKMIAELSGYDGIYNKDTGTFAIYNTTKLKKVNKAK